MHVYTYIHPCLLDLIGHLLQIQEGGHAVVTLANKIDYLFRRTGPCTTGFPEDKKESAFPVLPGQKNKSELYPRVP